ncbi:MAG: hypothetical protein AAGA95_16890, partial [Pseudomonadota bacterium]
MSQADIDPEALKRYNFSVWNYKQGEMVSLMIHLGDRLGLYRALAGAGAVTAAELAESTGLKERWLLEWLRGQAAARLLRYEAPDRFELPPEGVAVLADEQDSLHFAAGAFASLMPPETAEKIAEAFQTGIGLSYEQLGPNAAHRTERMLGPWTRQALVPQIIPALDGVADKPHSLLANAVDVKLVVVVADRNGGDEASDARRVEKEVLSVDDVGALCALATLVGTLVRVAGENPGGPLGVAVGPENGHEPG